MVGSTEANGIVAQHHPQVCNKGALTQPLPLQYLNVSLKVLSKQAKHQQYHQKRSGGICEIDLPLPSEQYPVPHSPRRNLRHGTFSYRPCLSPSTDRRHRLTLLPPTRLHRVCPSATFYQVSPLQVSRLSTAPILPRPFDAPACAASSASTLSHRSLALSPTPFSSV